MQNHKLKLLMALLIFSLFVFSGCEKAKETMDSATETVSDAAGKVGDVAKDAADKAGNLAKDAVDKTGEAAKDVANKAGEVVEGAVDKVADVFKNNGMIGTWTGKLDGKATTLEITKQDGNNFEGKITIKYRTPIHQKVKGSYNPETHTLTMADQIRSRVKGKYKGKLSEDAKTFSGTFTTIVDKKSFKFELTKK